MENRWDNVVNRWDPMENMWDNVVNRWDPLENRGTPGQIGGTPWKIGGTTVGCQASLRQWDKMGGRWRKTLEDRGPCRDQFPAITVGRIVAGSVANRG